MSSNLAKRLLVALAAIPLILLITWQGAYLFLAFVLLICVLALWEFAKICQAKSVVIFTPVGYICGTALLVAFYFWHDRATTALLLVMATAIFTRELLRLSPMGGIERVAFSFFGTFYAFFLMGHAILLRELPQLVDQPYGRGMGFIFLAFIPTWTGDTAAYGFGSKLGRHKLCPPISPGKSVEGAFFGILFSMLAGIVLKLLYADYLSYGQAAVLGGLLGVVAIVGDLIESLFKRDAGVKDSSALLPGHGGILDRFDASFLTLPATYYFLRYVVF